MRYLRALAIIIVATTIVFSAVLWAQRQGVPGGTTSGEIVKPPSDTPKSGEGHTNVQIFRPNGNPVIEPPPRDFYTQQPGTQQPDDSPQK